jgi:pyruvate, orthophosphate dikinase
VDLVLQVLHVKGRATLDALAAALQADPADAVAGLVAAGLVEDSRLGYKLTERARSRVDELYAQERERASGVIDDVYTSFGPMNDEVKQIITDWQMRSVGGQLTLNDHADHRYDEAVVARLRHTDAQVAAALAPLTEAVARFALYPERLRRALALVGEGDHSMVAAPLKDSYHTVWFELHQELFTLAGRSRADEEGAT